MAENKAGMSDLRLMTYTLCDLDPVFQFAPLDVIRSPTYLSNTSDIDSDFGKADLKAQKPGF
jgi:hypothetical protein